MTKRLTIVEVTPSVTTAGWSLHSGLAYKKVVSSWYQTLYRRVAGVKFNDDTLTARTSAADVVSNVGSWFHDDSTDELYVRAPLGSLLPQDQTKRFWLDIAAAPISGYIYACVFNGDIYRRSTAGANFVPLGLTNRAWTALAVDSSDNLYAAAFNGDIYVNDFPLGQTARNWYAMAASGLDVYACVPSGDIYKRTGGAGNFVALGQTSRNWQGMCSTPGGNVYACESGGDIYMQTAGAGNFNALSQTTRNWTGLAAASNGDVYACVDNGDVYKQTAGAGNFVALSQTSRRWWGLAVDSDDTLYACTLNDDLYAWLAPDPALYTVQVLVTYYFATEGVVINRLAATPSSGIYYSPWVLGDSLSITREVSDLVSGVTLIQSGAVSFVNGHGIWNYLIPEHNWQNKKVVIAVASFEETDPVPDRPDFDDMMTMLIRDRPIANETVAEIQLVELQSLLSKVIPLNNFTVEQYPNIGEGVKGQSKPLIWGRVIKRAHLTDTSGYGTYTIADADYQALFAVNSVTAINKSTGARSTLTLTTHYTVNLTSCTVTIVSASYPHADYEIEVDVSGKPYSGSYHKLFSTIVQDILQTFLNVPSSDLDAASFTAALTSAPQELDVCIDTPRTIASIFSSDEVDMPSLEKSVLGLIRVSPSGKWNVRVHNDATPVSSVVLTKTDFSLFNPIPRSMPLIPSVAVYYAKNHSYKTWSIFRAKNRVVKSIAESNDEKEVFTFLSNTFYGSSYAESLASNLLTILSADTIEVDFEAIGTDLALEMAGDFVTVSFDPVPVTGQAFVAEELQLQRVSLTFSPVLKITGRFKQF